MLVLNSDLQAPSGEDRIVFDHYMSLQGKVYRALEGRRTVLVDLHGKPYFIKQHWGASWKEILKNLFQFRLPIMGAKNEWAALKKLANLNISVPRVVGFGSKRKRFAQLQSFIITEALPPHDSLEDICREWGVKPPSFNKKLILLKEVARTARLMHQAGINHRDFYLCHFLWERGTKNKLYLIDLHRAGIRKKVPKRWLIKDLAGLYFSSYHIGLTNRDLLRFMKEYRNKSLSDILKLEPSFWAKVRQRGERLYRKENAGSKR